MPQKLIVVAFAVSPEDGATESVLERIERSGGVVDSHNWVRVTDSASGGQATDVEGYNALTVHVEASSPEALREALQPNRLEQMLPGVDLNVIDARWFDNSVRKLVVTDVDSTLIRQEVIEMLAAHAGLEAEVAAVTERAMRGDIDFEQSLRDRVSVLKDLPVSVIHEVSASVRLSPGATVLVKTLLGSGHAVAAVSGGFNQILDPLAENLGLTRAAANTLEIEGGVLTGRVVGPVVDREAKARLLRQWAEELDVAPENVIAVGDGANDIDMCRAAGLSVAYRAKPALREVTDTQLNIPNLDALRFFVDL